MQVVESALCLSVWSKGCTPREVEGGDEVVTFKFLLMDLVELNNLHQALVT